MSVSWQTSRVHMSEFFDYVGLGMVTIGGATGIAAVSRWRGYRFSGRQLGAKKQRKQDGKYRVGYAYATALLVGLGGLLQFGVRASKYGWPW